jgi:mono/diheme cytochrome c family protein
MKRVTRGTAGALALAAVLALATGCGSTKRSIPTSRQEPLDPQQQRGQVLFMKYCNACHPQGEGGIGGTLNNKPFPEAALRLKVRTGLGLDMPRFSDEELPEPDLDAIVEFMQTFRTNDDAVDEPEELDD